MVAPPLPPPSAIHLDAIFTSVDTCASGKATSVTNRPHLSRGVHPSNVLAPRVGLAHGTAQLLCSCASDCFASTSCVFGGALAALALFRPRDAVPLPLPAGFVGLCKSDGTTATSTAAAHIAAASHTHDGNADAERSPLPFLQNDQAAKERRGAVREY